jgi:hypothetical protein
MTIISLINLEHEEKPQNDDEYSPSEDAQTRKRKASVW